MIKNALFSLLLIFSVAATAQKYTLSGTISDSTNGESLINATIMADGTGKGCAANVYGFYSLQLPPGEYVINYSYVGYQVKTIKVNLTANQRVDVKMKPELLLGEVKVNANRVSLPNRRISSIEINLPQTHKTPTIMGEPDMIKIMQMSPGVEGGLEGSSGLYVRGGDNGQNLILIDGIPVYNVSHLMGYISVFNPEAVRKSELLKGGMPARFGGRASSVVDIRMKEGNTNQLKGVINISTLMAGGQVEGPIGQKTSFMLAARRTILDPVYSNFNNAQTSWDMLYSAWDVNAKINHKLNEKNRLYASFFTGYDHARSKGDGSSYKITEMRQLNDGTQVTDTINVKTQDKERHKWGNLMGAIRWNHEINSKLFLNTSATYTTFYNRHIEEYYRDETNLTTGQEINKGTFFKSTSDIEDMASALDFDWYAAPTHTVRFGLQGIYHQFRPTAQFDSLTSVHDDGSFVKPAWEGAAYLEDEFNLGTRLKVNAGMRLAAFSIENNDYYSFEPRLALTFSVNDNWTLNSSYTKARQYVHLISPSTVGFATDYWVPVSKNLKPEVSEQVAVGSMFQFGNGYMVQVEGYYKTMNNVIEFRDDRVFTMEDQNWENFMTTGKGWAYGIETMIAKNEGKLTGWISYTFARSWRKFALLNHGQTYPFKYDRPHNLTMVAMYHFNEKWDIGANWMLTSGYNFTFGKEVIGYETYYYGKNNMRYPAYHRLDLGVNWNKEKKYGKRTWRFGAYNAYNHMNASYYKITMPETTYVRDDNGFYKPVTSDPKVIKVTLFPIIPYISYRFAFGK